MFHKLRVPGSSLAYFLLFIFSVKVVGAVLLLFFFKKSQVRQLFVNKMARKEHRITVRKQAPDITLWEAWG